MKIVKEETLDYQKPKLSELLSLEDFQTRDRQLISRNFRLEAGNIEGLKALTAMAKRKGLRLTQDDAINDILREWFAEKGLLS